MIAMKIILYDASQDGLLGWSWSIGSFRPGWTRIGVKSWWDAKDKIIDAARPGTRLQELQLWGHGEPGEPLIASKTPQDSFWNSIATLVEANSLIWFRMCSVLYGVKGLMFVQDIADKLGCRVAAHTRVIGSWQSGLYSLGPGEEKNSDLDRNVIDDWRNSKSSWCAPRTIFCTRLSFPENW